MKTINFINKNGELTEPEMWFDHISKYSNGYVVVDKNKSYSYVDNNGHLLNENMWFEQCGNLINGKALVAKDGFAKIFHIDGTLTNVTNNEKDLIKIKRSISFNGRPIVYLLCKEETPQNNNSETKKSNDEYDDNENKKYKYNLYDSSLILNEWVDKIPLKDDNYIHIKYGSKWNILYYSDVNKKWNMLSEWNKIIPIFSDADESTARRFDREFIIIDEADDLNDVKTYKKISYIKALKREELKINNVLEYKIKNEENKEIIIYFLSGDERNTCFTIINDDGEIFCADDNLLELYLKDENIPRGCNTLGNTSYIINVNNREYILMMDFFIKQHIYEIKEKTEPIHCPWDDGTDKEAIFIHTENDKDNQFSFACDTSTNSFIPVDGAYLMDKLYFAYNSGDVHVIIDLTEKRPHIKTYPEYDDKYIDFNDIMTIKKSDGSERYDYLCNNRYLLVENGSDEIFIYDLFYMSYVMVNDYGYSFKCNLKDKNLCEDLDIESIAVKDVDDEKWSEIDPNKTYSSRASYFLGSNYQYHTNIILQGGVVTMDFDEDWAKEDLIENSLYDRVLDLVDNEEYESMDDLRRDLNRDLSRSDHIQITIDSVKELLEMLSKCYPSDDDELKTKIEEIKKREESN